MIVCRNAAYRWGANQERRTGRTEMRSVGVSHSGTNGRINTPGAALRACSGRTLTHRVRCPKRRSALQTGIKAYGFGSYGSQAQGSGQAGSPTWPSPVSLRLTAELMKPSTHIDKIVAYKPSSVPTHGESECRTTVGAAGCARDGASQSQPDEGKARRPASLAVFAPEAVWDGLAEKERCHWAFARALVCACVCMALCTK